MLQQMMSDDQVNSKDQLMDKKNIDNIPTNK